MVDGGAVKEHKTVMKKATQAKPQESTTAGSWPPPAPPANNSKTKREQALSPENACFFVYFIEKKQKTLVIF